MAAVGTVTITNSKDRPIKQVVFDWVSDAATGAISGGAGLTSFVVSGQIVRITTDPGSPAPTANYDIVLNDADGIDVSGGQLQNRHTSNTESVIPTLAQTPTGGSVTGFPVFVDGTLELVISNCGTSKAGTCRVYYI